MPTKIILIGRISTLTTEQCPVYLLIKETVFLFVKPRAGFKDTVCPFLNLHLTPTEILHLSFMSLLLRYDFKTIILNLRTPQRCMTASRYTLTL